MQIKRGVQAYEILKLIGYSKEYPRRNLKLLAGENKWMVRAVRKLVDEGYMSINKRYKLRTLRLLKKGRKALVDAGVDFELAVSGVNRSGDITVIERTHRVAEVITMCRRAGVSVYPGERALEYLSGCPPSLWLTHELRADIHLKDSKSTSPCVGVLGIGSTKYILYNIGRNLIYWLATLEYQVQASLQLNYFEKIDRLIVFGESNRVITLHDGDGKKKTTLLGGLFTNTNQSKIRVDSGMKHLHFIELSEYGIRLLKLMQDEYWNQLIYFILSEDEIAGKPNDIVCDGKCADGRPVLLMFDMDLVRLKMFLARIRESRIPSAKIFCFDWQKDGISALIDCEANIEFNFYSFDQIEHAFCNEREVNTT